MAVMCFHLLGGFEVTRGEASLPPVSGTIARSLLAYLVTYHDRSHTRDLLAGTFWPDLPDAQARRRLSHALWQIRSAMDPHPVILTEGDTIRINRELPLWLDVDAFTEHYAACMSGGAEALFHGERCQELYQGEFLAGYYDDWAVVERERLREMLIQVLERLLEGHKAGAEYEQALTVARRLAVEDPWREGAHREVMRLCHVLGRDAEALKQFEVCRQTLVEELGVEPSPETQALVAEIATRSEAQLELVRPPVLPSAARPGRGPLLERPDRLPLVGRREELAELLHEVEVAAEGSGGLTMVYGEAGVGKSRLLRELAENADWRGVRVAWGRCYELAAPPAYQPLLEALRARLCDLREGTLEPLWRAELSRLLPELTTGEAPPSLSPEEEQRRLLEAITRGFLALAEVAPTLVLLEDAQWMDPASLEGLRYLLPRLADARLLLVVTVRSEELAGRVAKVVSAMENTRLARRLELGRLDRAETEKLVQRILGLEEPAPVFSARMYVETEGNPFFLIETLWALVEEGLLRRDEEGDWSTAWDESTEDYSELPLPPGVKQSIQRRLDRLPHGLQRLLNLAAVIGREVGFEVWRQASGRDAERVLTAAEALCARGLLLAPDHPGAEGADYTFAHDQIRRVAYERLSAPRRRAYHRQVAQALTEVVPEAGAHVAALAHHWTGAEAWDRSAVYHQQAGDRARGVYANVEAVNHYTQALAALERLPGPVDPLVRYELHLAREGVYDLLGEREAQAGDLEALEVLAASGPAPSEPEAAARRARVELRRAHFAVVTADYATAMKAAEQAIGHARHAGDTRLEALAHREWGEALRRQADFDGARQQLEVALELARAAALRAVEAKSLYDLGVIATYQGDCGQARAYLDQALNIFREPGDAQGEGRALNSLGSVARIEADYALAQERHRQALRILRRIGDRRGESSALNNLGVLARRRGDYPGAREYYEQAARVAREIGDRSGEGTCLGNLGVVLRNQGDYAGARACYERALAIQRETGDRIGESLALGNLGNVCRDQGDYMSARAYYGQSLHLSREIGDRQGEGLTLENLGLVAATLGDPVQARSYVEESLQIAREVGNRQAESFCLVSLGLLLTYVGDHLSAWEHASQALTLAQKLGERNCEAYAQTILGRALTSLGRTRKATQAFQQAVDLRRELGQRHLALEPLAGLAWALWLEGDLTQAQEHVEQIVDSLETGNLDVLDDALQVYLTCYRVLQAAHDARAATLLHAACELLQARAAAIPDEETRCSFMGNVPSHREILAACQEREATVQERENDAEGSRRAAERPERRRRITVSLPWSEAPLGRPLRDDEFVAVTWTVAAPEDETVASKTCPKRQRRLARRRHRILRLLREAEAQGAAPRDEDLARALEVSLSTLRRDMAALRQEGHDIRTRWRKMST
jgi:DNA-binding SARP family transcriptional activator/Tfp pilus assembly protein PilF